MNNPKQIIQDIAHRPWGLPQGVWAYYQEWNRSLFLHWKIPTDILQSFIPHRLILDTFDKESWVSVVAFTMENVRPRGLPPFSPISDFHELNLRTYVTTDGKPGVYFLHISAHKQFSAWVAKRLSGLPYEKSEIHRTLNDGIHTYALFNRKQRIALKAEFTLKDGIRTKSALDSWLTERYCLYLDRGNKLIRYEIHHSEWKLYHIDLQKFIIDPSVLSTINPGLRNLPLVGKPDMMNYSEGVKVLAWSRRL